MDMVDIRALVDKLEGECDSCEDNGGCSIEVLTREDLRPVLSYAKSKMPTDCGHVEPKQKMALVPIELLNEYCATLRELVPAFYVKLGVAIANAPIAAIPLTEVPGNCNECEFCYDSVACSRESVKAVNLLDSRPIDCPIVTKE
jgi:hypothetical protein